MREFIRESIDSKMISPFIKAIGRARGSKKLFASAQRVAADVEKAAPFNFPKEKTFKNHYEKLSGYNADIFSLTPENGNEPQRAVIYLHGGAFIRQPSPLHYKLIDGIVSVCPAKLYFVSYIKPPKATYKEAYGALEKLYAQLTEQVGSDNVYFAGDSAGASICISFADYIIKKGLPSPKKIIAICPVCDLTLSNPKIGDIIKKDPMLEIDGLLECSRRWEGSSNIKNSEINPCCADFSRMPKTVVFTGTCEILNPDIEQMYEQCQKQGGSMDLYVYENMCHVFPLYPVPAAKKAREIIYKEISE